MIEVALMDALWCHRSYQSTPLPALNRTLFELVHWMGRVFLNAENVNQPAGAGVHNNRLKID